MGLEARGAFCPWHCAGKGRCSSASTVSLPGRGVLSRKIHQALARSRSRRKLLGPARRGSLDRASLFLLCQDDQVCSSMFSGRGGRLLGLVAQLLGDTDLGRSYEWRRQPLHLLFPPCRGYLLHAGYTERQAGALCRGPCVCSVEDQLPWAESRCIRGPRSPAQEQGSSLTDASTGGCEGRGVCLRFLRGRKVRKREGLRSWCSYH